MKKHATKQSNLRFVLKTTLSRKVWYVFLLPILTLLLGQKEVVIAWLSAQIFNSLQSAVTGEHDLRLLYSAICFSILLLLVSVVQWLITTLSDLIENDWREKVNLTFQKKFMGKDYKRNIADFDDPDLQSRYATAKKADLVGQIKAVVASIGKIGATVSFAIILWRYSPLLVLVAFVIKMPVYFLSGKVNDENRKYQMETNAVNREKNYCRNIPVQKPHVKEFKIFDMKKFVCEKFRQIVEKYYLDFKGRYAKKTTYATIVEHFDKILVLVVQILMGLSVFSGEMLFGDFTLLIAAFGNLSGSMEILANFAAQCKDFHVQNNMLREYLEANRLFEDGESQKRRVDTAPHTIEFRHVSFSYPGTDRKILDDLSITMTEGKTYGLVGLNGSGKSTLVNLLLQLYEPDSGEILLDGADIREYNIVSYYEAISCVLQKTTHYAMTIKEYVACGKTADVRRVNDAIGQAGLAAWCDSLPHGQDTMLTRAFSDAGDSVDPSGGQWQKLSIARALYKNAPILILDEPSASLDVDSEHEIFGYITRLSEKKTALLISHRLSNMIDCDHIFVLHSGRMQEQGTHRSLMEKKGVYADLFESQARNYRTQEAVS